MPALRSHRRRVQRDRTSRAQSEALCVEGSFVWVFGRAASALVTGLLVGRSVVSGSGVTSPKSRSSGCRAGHAGLHESFLVSSRTPIS